MAFDSGLTLTVKCYFDQEIETPVAHLSAGDYSEEFAMPHRDAEKTVVAMCGCAETIGRTWLSIDFFGQHALYYKTQTGDWVKGLDFEPSAPSTSKEEKGA